jgi:Hypervirulence associated proteins TUDOR domain
MPKTFRIGDSVEFDGPSGKVRGTVRKKLTQRTELRGKTIDATEDRPRYLVANDETGAETDHDSDSLDKVD